MKKNTLAVCLLILAMMLMLTGCKKCEHQYSVATCTQLATCALCGETMGELEAHAYAEATCQLPATCTVCGVTEGLAVDHQYSEATCTAPETCAFCGLTQGEVLPHSFSEANCSAPATCSGCGLTEGEPLAHSFSKATCLENATCTVCGLVSDEKGSHSYEKSTCTICGYRNPRYDEIAGVLKKIERYPNYLDIDCDILETRIDLYKLTGKASDLVKIMDSVAEMNGYISKIRSACAEYPELRMVYDECNSVEYPGTAGSSTSAIRNYLSAANRFKRQCSYVCIAYNAAAKYYGIK